jgi:hypothetical protein
MMRNVQSPTRTTDHANRDRCRRCRLDTLRARAHGEYRSWGGGRNARIQERSGRRDLIWLTGTGCGGGLVIDAATFPGTSTRLVRQVDAILASVEAGDWEF